MNPVLAYITGDRPLNWTPRAFVRCLLAVYWYGFYSVVGSSLQFFHCVLVPTLDGSMTVIQTHPVLDCGSETYREYSIIFGFVLFVELAIPLAICLALVYRNLQKRSKTAVDPVSRAPKPKLEPFDEMFSAFFSHYRLPAWEFLGLAVKRIPLLCIIVFSTSAQIRLALCSIFTIAHTLMQVVYKPFLDEVDNLLECFSLVCLNLLVAVLFTSNLDVEPSQDQATVQFTFLVIVFIVLLCFVLTSSLSRLEPINDRLDKVRKRFFPRPQEPQSVTTNGVIGSDSHPPSALQSQSIQMTIHKQSSLQTLSAAALTDEVIRDTPSLSVTDTQVTTSDSAGSLPQTLCLTALW